MTGLEDIYLRHKDRLLRQVIATVPCPDCHADRHVPCHELVDTQPPCVAVCGGRFATFAHPSRSPRTP